jgi:hypothetical protein
MKRRFAAKSTTAAAAATAAHADTHTTRGRGSDTGS